MTALIVVLSTGQAQAKPVLLQPTSSSGPDPFTASPTKTPAAAGPSASPTVPSSTSGAQVVSGSTVGLYGGTEKVSSCDVPQLVTFLTTHQDKGAAWAGVEGIQQSDIPAYLHALTPVVLRVDTRVTNHGFRNGAATSFQSVLQAGTAVLVDSRGVPRVRCSCGNPLLPPAAKTSETFTGPTWTSFRPTNVVVIAPTVVNLTVIVLFDPDTGTWFARPTGGSGGNDHKVPPPTNPTTLPPSTSSSPSTSGTPCPSPSPGSPSTPCPSTSTSTPSSSSTSSTSTSSTTSTSTSASSSSPPSAPTSSTQPSPTGASH